jgi:hypothetical protein
MNAALVGDEGVEDGEKKVKHSLSWTRNVRGLHCQSAPVSSGRMALNRVPSPGPQEDSEPIRDFRGRQEPWRTWRTDFVRQQRFAQGPPKRVRFPCPADDVRALTSGG